MKRFLRAAAVLAGCAVGMVSGCHTLPTDCGSGCGGGGCGGANGEARGSCKDLYDPCWPERYNTLARRSVNHAMAPQVMNGHVLDQTVWNYHFEEGTDKLTPGGLDHLQYVARRRPCPDKTLYMATSLDLKYDPACPDRFAGARQELDTLRVASVQKYLTALNSGRPMDFDIKLHDPGDPSLRGNGPTLAIQQMYGRFRGGLPTVAGGASAAASGTGVGTGN